MVSRKIRKDSQLKQPFRGTKFQQRFYYEQKQAIIIKVDCTLTEHYVYTETSLQ